MCESVMKFESNRLGVFSNRRDSLTNPQNSRTINTLNADFGGRFLSYKGSKFFYMRRKYRDMAINAKSCLEKETVLSNQPKSSNILIIIKTAIAAIFKRNKTQSNTVDTGY